MALSISLFLNPARVLHVLDLKPQSMGRYSHREVFDQWHAIHLRADHLASRLAVFDGAFAPNEWRPRRGGRSCGLESDALRHRELSWIAYQCCACNDGYWMMRQMRCLNDGPLHRRFLYFTFTSSTTLKPQGARVEVSRQDCLSFGGALSHHDIAIMIVRRLIWRICLCPRDMR